MDLRTLSGHFFGQQIRLRRGRHGANTLAVAEELLEARERSAAFQSAWLFWLDLFCWQMSRDLFCWIEVVRSFAGQMFRDLFF